MVGWFEAETWQGEAGRHLADFARWKAKKVGYIAYGCVRGDFGGLMLSICSCVGRSCGASAAAGNCCMYTKETQFFILRCV